jgi:AcrR family transcriptional regulator
MTGKPKFDDRSVIAAAVDVFWRQGYAAASIGELTAATGLSRSSLYQRFGDKDGVFREALDAYAGRVLSRMNAAGAETARGRMEALLRGFLPSGRTPGCLVGRSCVEEAALTAAGQDACRDAVVRQRAILSEILADGVRRGELPADADVEALSWYYFGMVQMLVNLPNAGADPGVTGRVVDVAMAAWPLTGGVPG